MTQGVLVLSLAAYLVANVNAATVLARSRGVDIRGTGSGNPGASNVYRTMGKGPAAIVYLVDLLKGFVPALIGLLMYDAAVGMFAGFAAVIGHCVPIFHRFRGGKGVATGSGALLAITPIVLVGLIVVYVLTVRITKVSSAGSLAAVLLAVPLALLSGLRGWALAWLACMIVLIIARHRSNISRLVGGSEHKVVSNER